MEPVDFNVYWLVRLAGSTGVSDAISLAVDEAADDAVTSAVHLKVYSGINSPNAAIGDAIAAAIVLHEVK